MSIDAQIEAWVRPLAQGLSDLVFYPIQLFDQDFPLIVLWLAIAALWFTFYLRLINLRGFGHAVRLLINPPANAGATGEISHFKALSTAISGTVGVGNIGGVAGILAAFLGRRYGVVESTARCNRVHAQHPARFCASASYRRGCLRRHSRRHANAGNCRHRADRRRHHHIGA